MLNRLKNKILRGDVRDLLKQLPDESVDCCVTSPPYWALRNYNTHPLIWAGKVGCRHEWEMKKQKWHSDRGSNKRKEIFSDLFQTTGTVSDTCKKCGAWRGSLGQEPNMELFVEHLCDIFDEIKRVLKKTGTCWVNLGDTYQGSPVSGKEGGFSGRAARNNPDYAKAITVKNRPKSGLPDKCLCQIPSRFAIEMIKRGWILRNEIIWHKPNAMPSSARDRFTVDFEKVFFFVKSNRYYFEQQLEEYTQPMNRWGGARLVAKGKSDWDGGTGQKTYRNRGMRPNESGRNKRCVWTVNTKPFAEAHFATFPEDLIKTPIEAGCPGQICNKCGQPRTKLFKRTGIGHNESATKYNTKNSTAGRLAQKRQAYRKMGFEKPPAPEFIGYSDCGCNAEFCPGVVLDPFLGAGTTVLVAKKSGRDYLGMELNPDYVKIAERRLKNQLLKTKV